MAKPGSGVSKGRYCTYCYAHGIVRNKKTQRWEQCPCGRLPDSFGMGKLAQQAKLDARLKELKEKGW